MSAIFYEFKVQFDVDLSQCWSLYQIKIDFFSVSFFPVTGQWTQNATKLRTSSCRHIIHIQHIHMIEWRYQIQENVCPAHISNTHQVHLKNDVFKHHVVFQKPQYLPEGKEHAFRAYSIINSF